MREPATTPDRSDPDALWRRWRETGDPSALGALFDATAPELFGVALHLCRDPARAEDALQETFLAALEAPDRHDAERRVVPWLVGILRNKLHEVRRFAARAPDPARVARPAAAGDPVLDAANAEEEERIRRALAELPEPYREVAMLRWRHGLEPAEIAELKRMAPGTVRSLLHRALERLRRSLVALPSLLFGGRDGAEARGLDAVRGAVIAGAPGAAVAAGSVVVLGGFVMAKKSLAAAVVAVVVLAAAGVGVWSATRPDAGAAPAAGPVVGKAAPAAPSIPPAGAPAASEPPPAEPAAPEIPPPVDLSKCDRDLDLFGVVVDSKDAPVPGARLSLFEYPLRRGGILTDGLGYWKERPGPSCLSSTDGSFAFRLKRGQLTHLRAMKAGLAEAVLSDCQAGERVKLVMEPAGRFVVRVCDEKGNAVPGVRLLLVSSWKLYFTRLQRHGVTDASGRCVFEGLPAGRVSLYEVEHDRLARDDHPRADVPAGGEVELEVVLVEGRTVRGSVVDAETGKPITGARIGAYWVLRRPVLSKEDGTFAYPGWLGGEGADLHVVAEGWGRMSQSVPADGEVVFRLNPGDEAIGRCVGADGTPVADAVVCAMGSVQDGSRQRLDTVTTATGTDGRFRLVSLRRDLPHTLVVMAPGHGRFLLDFPPREAGPGTIDLGDLRLPEARRIEGRVVGPDGVAVPDARVELNGANADRGRLMPKGARPAQGHYGSREMRRTDDLGRFRFPDLAPGLYEVEVAVEGRPEKRVSLELPGGKDLPPLEIRLGAGMGKGDLALAVEVVDERGTPVAGILVDVSQGRDRAERSTGGDGCAVLEGLQAGHASVSTRDPREQAPLRYLSTSTNVKLPLDGPHRVVLRPRAEVTGTVLGPDGKGIGGFMVCAKEESVEGQPQWYAQVDSEGRFRVEVPPGVALSVMLPDARTGAGAIPYRGRLDGVIAPAKDVVLRVRPLKNDLALVVELRDAGGNPVCEGHLMIHPGGRRPEHRPFEPAGRIEMRDLLEDPIHAMVQAPREPVHPAWTQEVPPAPRDLVPGTEEVIVFRFRKGVPLRGRVVDEQGNRVAGAVVAVQTQDWATRWVMAGEDGSFATVVLPGEKLRSLIAEKRSADGKTLRVEHSDFAPGEGDVVLTLVPAQRE